MSAQAANVTSWFETSGKVNLLGAEVTMLTIFLTVAIIVVGFLVAHLVRLITTKYIGSRVPPDTRRTMGRFVYYVIIAIALLSALGISGIDLSGVFLAGGIAGIVIGFATQSLFSNLISGVFLQLDRPMRIGDPVLITGKLPDVAGVVVEITMLSSRLRMFDGTYVRLPNSDVFLSEIRNYSSAGAKRIEFSCYVGYKENLSRVIAMIQSSLAGTPLVLVEPPPDIYVEKLEDSAVVISVWCWVPFSVWFDMRKQLVQQIKTELQVNGIEMPYRQRVLHMIPAGQKEESISGASTSESSAHEKSEFDG